MPRAPDVVRAVSDEANTVDADTHQVCAGERVSEGCIGAR